MPSAAIDVDGPVVAHRSSATTAEAATELERLRELNEFKSNIINAAAHELRTPLTPIRLQLHMLRQGQRGALTPEQRSSLDIVDRNVERLFGLVKDFLDVARIQSGRFPVSLGPVRVSSLVQEAVDSFTAPARAAGLRLETAVDEDATVWADPARIIQVVFNLVGNAIKFTPPGGTIRLLAKRSPEGVRIEVEDTGVGFLAEQSPLLFRPFSQLPEGQSTSTGGVGLGLFISRSIIELHGGRIWATSPGPGKGARFGFSLPLAPESARAEPDSMLHREDAFAERVRRLI